MASLWGSYKLPFTTSLSRLLSVTHHSFSFSFQVMFTAIPLPTATPLTTPRGLPYLQFQLKETRQGRWNNDVLFYDTLPPILWWACLPIYPPGGSSCRVRSTGSLHPSIVIIRSDLVIIHRRRRMNEWTDTIDGNWTGPLSVCSTRLLNPHKPHVLNEYLSEEHESAESGFFLWYSG